MGMPLELLLVRHGDSKGNEAVRRSKQGDHGAYTDAFKNQHSSLWRLTDLGREQARIAGAWIRDNVGDHFDRYYTSEYIRAQETAANLGLPGARWYCEFYLRERDRGDIDVIAQNELAEKYEDSLRRREIDAFYWTPPNGESMAQLCLRVDRVLNTLHRECDGKRVIINCHGETMWALRIRLERMSQARYRELDASKDPKDRIHNAQILHYTRRHPFSDSPNAQFPAYEWMRSVCPTDLSLSRNEWEQIQRPSYTNEQLLENVEKHPRMIRE
jgi:NAD+ kinase